MEAYNKVEIKPDIQSTNEMSKSCNNCKVCKKCRYKKYLKDETKTETDNKSEDTNLNKILLSTSNNSDVIASQKIILTVNNFENSKMNQAQTPALTKNNFDFLSILTFQGKLVVPKTPYTDYLIKNKNEFLIIIPLLRDKIYYIHNEFMKNFENCIKTGENCYNNNLKGFYNDQGFNKRYVWSCYMKFLTSHYDSFIVYVKQIPGLETLSMQDIGQILKEKYFIIIDLSLRKLFIDDECYLTTNGVQISKYWMREFFGKKVSDLVFEFYQRLEEFKLTNNEIALLSAFVITSPDVYLHDPNALTTLNRYYYDVLMYEFSLNDRCSSFMETVFQIIKMYTFLKGRYEQVIT